MIRTGLLITFTAGALTAVSPGAGAQSPQLLAPLPAGNDGGQAMMEITPLDAVEAASRPSGNQWLDAVESMGRQATLLEQALKVDELTVERLKLSKEKKDLEKDGSKADIPLPPPPPRDNTAEKNLAPPPPPEPLPVVKVISGVDDRLEAVLRYGSGRELVVRKGDMVGNRTVSRVSPSGVTVIDEDGKATRLTFGLRPASL